MRGVRSLCGNFSLSTILFLFRFFFFILSCRISTQTRTGVNEDIHIRIAKYLQDFESWKQSVCWNWWNSFVRFETDSRERERERGGRGNLRGNMNREFPLRNRLFSSRRRLTITPPPSLRPYHVLRIECKPVLMHICSTLPFHNPTDLIYYHQRRPRTNDEKRERSRGTGCGVHVRG